MTTLPVIHLLEFSYADKKAVIERACSLLLKEKLLGKGLLKNFKKINLSYLALFNLVIVPRR
jgi:hypothetical protein